ncbi:MAG TPA: RidA family protein [Burkholderiales bacterium]|nr:RidA family protein [Burkholderiales bacterium]
MPLTDEIEHKLAKLGIVLPAAAVPAFQYVPVTVHERQAFVSGQLPREGDEVRIVGKVGNDVSVERAQAAARLCILQGLACLKQTFGSLDRIEQVLKVTGFVASAPMFNQQPKVIDAASELLVQVFGESGRHARSAIGVAELPRNACVEIEMIVALRP